MHRAFPAGLLLLLVTSWSCGAGKGDLDRYLASLQQLDQRGGPGASLRADFDAAFAPIVSLHADALVPGRDVERLSTLYARLADDVRAFQAELQALDPPEALDVEHQDLIAGFDAVLVSLEGLREGLHPNMTRSALDQLLTSPEWIAAGEELDRAVRALEAAATAQGGELDLKSLRGDA